MREKLSRFMQGRYGADELSRFMLVIAMILVVLSMLIKVNILNAIGFAILILTLFREFSKNYQARSRENDRYLAAKDKILGVFGRKGSSRSGNQYGSRYQQNQYQGNAGQSTTRTDNGYRIFKCPGCGQKIRVPSGRGKIEISCPKCQNKFIKKS